MTMTAEPETSLFSIVGTRRDGDLYTGVLRIGRRVVAECSHLHHNRDISTGTNGRSARDCIADVVRAAAEPAFAEQLVGKARDGWLGMVGGFWQVTAGQVERAKVDCADDARQLETLITQVREIRSQHPAPPAAPKVLVTIPAEPEVIGELPAWMTGEI